MPTMNSTSGANSGKDFITEFNACMEKNKVSRQEAGSIGKVLDCYLQIGHITMFVLSILAVCSVVPGPAFGATLLGYSGLAVLNYTAQEGISGGACGVAIMAVGIIMGSLATAGVVSGFAAGWTVLGMSIGCCPYYTSFSAGRSAAALN